MSASIDARIGDEVISNGLVPVLDVRREISTTKGVLVGFRAMEELDAISER